MGVVLFIFLDGHFPFNFAGPSSGHREAYQILKRGVRISPALKRRHPYAVDLVESLLKLNPYDRIQSAVEALSHCWLSPVSKSPALPRSRRRVAKEKESEFAAPESPMPRLVLRRDDSSCSKAAVESRPAVKELLSGSSSRVGHQTLAGKTRRATIDSKGASLANWGISTASPDSTADKRVDQQHRLLGIQSHRGAPPSRDLVDCCEDDWNNMKTESSKMSLQSLQMLAPDVLVANKTAIVHRQGVFVASSSRGAGKKGLSKRPVPPALTLLGSDSTESGASATSSEFSSSCCPTLTSVEGTIEFQQQGSSCYGRNESAVTARSHLIPQLCMTEQFKKSATFQNMVKSNSLDSSRFASSVQTMRCSRASSPRGTRYSLQSTKDKDIDVCSVASNDDSLCKPQRWHKAVSLTSTPIKTKPLTASRRNKVATPREAAPEAAADKGTWESTKLIGKPCRAEKIERLVKRIL